MFAALDFGGGEKEKVDLSLTMYADDIAKAHVVSSVEHAIHHLKKSNRVLSDKLRDKGHSQNESKQ
eukprot:15564493-Heterocapsa_arctica.AAC.1